MNNQHLEFIQNTISRLNTNSFIIKGWVITVTSGLVAFASSTNNFYTYIITLIPITSFWILDTSFLQQERKFRKLYDEIVKSNPLIPDYEINLDHNFIKASSRVKFFRVGFSVTMSAFYIPLIIFTSSCICLIERKDEASSHVILSVKDTINVHNIGEAKTLPMHSDTTVKKPIVNNN